MSSVPFYAKRFVAGVKMEEALESVQALNAKSISASLDFLGENITERSEADACVEEYVKLLHLIKEYRIDSHVSLKLTMLGLDIDEQFCYENLSKVLATADEINNRVALDMEGTPYTERTMAMYERACKEFKSPEIVLQAYLKRTESDFERVLNANGRLRLCKGAYKEPEELAYQKMSDIQENYKKLMSRAFLQANRVCIATHDDELIDFCEQFIATNKIPKEKYEFQMLYGMRAPTWEDIKNRGHNMTVYVPYGEAWQAYFSRRVTERKENLFFVMKNFFKK